MKKNRWRALVVVAAGYLVGTLWATWQGYRFGRSTLVRCRQGHLFTTTWVPGASLKAVRLGWYRFQRCPIGPHWALVKPVREADVSAEALAQAKLIHDTRIP